MVFSITIPASPVRAAGDIDITVGNGVCDFDSAGLGSGTVQDPYVVNTPKSLAEIADCRYLPVNITNATVSGSLVTYTASNTFIVGDTVTVSGVFPAAFNLSAVRVTAATSTEFTVQAEAAFSATYSGGGPSAIKSSRVHYEVRADIDLSTGTESWNNVASAGWLPIPDTRYITLNGNGKTINGLVIKRNASSLGLFAEISHSQINNLKFTNVNIDQSGPASHANVGALVGVASDSAASEIEVQGSVKGSQYRVGLMAGDWQSGNIRDSITSGTVSVFHATGAPDRIGGLVGRLYFGNITGSSSSATVNGFSDDGTTKNYGSNIGGLAGEVAGNVDQSSATGDVVGREYVGGLVGQHCCGGLTNSFATGDATGITNQSNQSANHVGGLLGITCCGGVSGSYSSGQVTAISRDGGGNLTQIGGFLGENSCCAGTSDNSSTGNVIVTVEQTSGTINVEHVGGSVGYWYCCGGDFDVVSEGSVTVVNNSAGSVSNVGGYSGYIRYEGQFERISASGNVSVTTATGSSASAIGGLVGNNQGEFRFVDVHASGNVVVNSGKEVGGLIGLSKGPTYISDSSATGNVSVSFDGNAQIGGLIGRAEMGGDYRNRAHTITRTFSSGTVSATPVNTGNSAQNVGGLIGDVTGTVTLQDVYVRSNVTGTSAVGGLFGQSNNATVDADRTYVANIVTATGTGATVDAVSNGLYVDTLGTNLYDATLADSLSNNARFIGKTTADMKTQATFSALGFVFDGSDPVWKLSTAENDGYPQLIPRPSQSSSTSTSGSTSSSTSSSSSGPAPATITRIVEVPAAKPPCMTPASLSLSFGDGSSRLTKQIERQIRQYVTRVKASNCTQVNLRAFFVKNSPLALTRNRVLETALQNEFWRQQYVVQIQTSAKATKARGALERTVQFTVPR